mmetsp:Transcript_46189/g.68815  ORF Transcript_46189/g.68815 Transcript_46189/m.68815 type:complete len:99 (-) Transcript_46189:1979-2275(-)
MCTELGDNDNLIDYVELATGSKLCDVNTSSGCSDREIAYVNKVKTADESTKQAQLERILKMDGQRMKGDLQEWMMRRKRILRQFLPKFDSQSGASDEL